MTHEPTDDSHVCTPQLVLPADTHQPAEGIRDVETDVHDHEESAPRVHGPEHLAGAGESHYAMPAQSAIDNAIRSLTDPGTRHGRPSNPLLRKVTSNLLRKEILDIDPNQSLHEEYLLHDKYFLCYAPLDRNPVSGVRQPLIPDLTSLVHALQAHRGVAATLALLDAKGPFVIHGQRRGRVRPLVWM